MKGKISLYFSSDAWDSLHRLVSLLLISGKPLNELPNMNDVVEGAVIFVSRILEEDYIDEEFVKYTQGYIKKKVHSAIPSYFMDKGRMAFSMSESGFSAIKSIRESKTLRSVESGSISDAILIRSCVYFILDGPVLMDFLLNLYLCNLFDIPPGSIHLGYKSIEKELELMSDNVRDRLMMTLWDKSLVFNLSDLFGVNHSSTGTVNGYLQDQSLMERDRIISQGRTPNLAFQSKGFRFNYLTAMYGWIILSYFQEDISSVTIPELAISFLDKYDRSKSKVIEENARTDILAVRAFLDGLNKIADMADLMVKVI